VSIKSSKSSQSEKGGSSLDFFEGQKDSRCGVHALNNLYRNYDGPDFIKNLIFMHGSCSFRGLEVYRKIDVDAICKAILRKKLAGLQGKDKKKLKSIWDCSDQGSYRIDIMEKAIQETGIDIIDHTIELVDVNTTNTKEASDAFYKKLKNKASSKGFMGYLIQNTDYGGHYIALLPRSGKLLLVDSADNWKSEKIENRPFKNGKWTGFRYLTRKKFREMRKDMTLIYELVDIETVIDSDED